VQSPELADRIGKLVLEKKAQDVVIMDMRRLISFTDFFIVCSVDTDVQAKAVQEHIEDQLRLQDEVKPWHVEGGSGASWILLDFVDVVVHIFRPEAREYYALEKLWGDAEITSIRDDPEEKR
jgi:ribosome-associated protein